MRRRLFTLCSALSLLLFVAVCVLWVRSYRVVDAFVRQSKTPIAVDPKGRTTDILEIRFVIWTSNGSVEAFRSQLVGWPLAGEVSRRSVRPAPGRPTVTTYQWHPEEPARWFIARREPERPTLFSRIGLRHTRAELLPAKRWRPADNFERITFPLWLPAVAAAVLPALHLRRVGRERWLRRNPGLCPSCGYDLRASPGRCPECGTEVQSA